MNLKSNFKSDLQKERKLAVLIDNYYHTQLKNYHFERIYDLKRQLQGIDLILAHKTSETTYYLDEKAQLDYINEDLPTFAFELDYQKKGETKLGWLFDEAKKTHFYALITAIYCDEPETFTSCKITVVNRQKLISFLKSRNIDNISLKSYIKDSENQQGKTIIKGLDPQIEGYLYFSKMNKAEMPTNLILKLDFLIDNGIAKRLA